MAPPVIRVDWEAWRVTEIRMRALCGPRAFLEKASPVIEQLNGHARPPRDEPTLPGLAHWLRRQRQR